MEFGLSGLEIRRSDQPDYSGHALLRKEAVSSLFLVKISILISFIDKYFNLG